jgi:MFS superfamily sulfate permease-like transporter
MYIQFLRTALLLLLIFVAVIDLKYLEFALAKEWQYIIAVSVLFTLLFVDSVTGFIFAVILAILYVRIYDVKIFSTRAKYTVFDEKALEFITPEHLAAAQSNVVSPAKEYIGIKGVYGEDVYGAQGLYEVKPGYSSDVAPGDSLGQD